MTKQEMIKALAVDLPPYAAHLRGTFVPGKTQVLYSGPFFGSEEIEAGLSAFLSGQWITAGEYVAKFQKKFSRQFNVKHSHMVNSGSSANLVMIAALKKRFNWADGDEVVVSPTGFPTTVSSIVQNGLVPVFVDVEMRTLNFDVSLIEGKITDRTRAVFVSPVLGNPPDMDLLKALCFIHGVLLIGDHCDSLGTKWDGHLLNEMYHSWTTSFYPAHHITTGEGGMVSSDDEEVIKLARSFSWWGRECYCIGKANLLPCGTCGKRFSNWLGEDSGVMDHKYVFSQMGWNLKPLDICGAVGLAQLEKFPEIEKRRRANKEEISKFFQKGHAHVGDKLPKADPSWFGVPVVCFNEEVKNSLVAHLEKNLVQTRPYFAGNLLRHPWYKNLGSAKDFPNSDRVFRTSFFLGCPPHYTAPIINYIGEVLRKWTF
jgi:CDP-4-dehydro-6-deoxyglucose reductase, E1